MTPLLRVFPRLAPGFLLLLSGCATEPESVQLLGSWETAAEDLNPGGWHQSRLTFGLNKMFASEVRSYGLYEGQDRNDLSAYSRIEGVYEVEGDQLIFRTRRLKWWDGFYGTHTWEKVEEPYEITLYDDAHYSVEGDQLLLNYLSFPFDAPVETSQEFVRVDQD